MKYTLRYVCILNKRKFHLDLDISIEKVEHVNTLMETIKKSIFRNITVPSCCEYQLNNIFEEVYFYSHKQGQIITYDYEVPNCLVQLILFDSEKLILTNRWDLSLIEWSSIKNASHISNPTDYLWHILFERVSAQMLYKKLEKGNVDKELK